MRYIVNKNDILPLLTRVNNVIEKKSTQKIRTNVLISAKEQQLELIGFDNEIKISGSISAQIQEEGEITVSSQKFFDIVKSLSPNNEIEIQVLDNSMHIISGSSKFQLATIPAEDYPLPDKYEFDKSLSLNGEELVSLLNAVKFSMGTNDVRHYLNGLLLHFTQTEVVAVSTDGHRLSVSEIENKFDITDHKLILPRKTISEITSWLAAEQGDVAINISDTHIEFSLNNINITSTLINAEYPSYESVIPELSEKQIIIPREELKVSLQRAKILSSEYGVGVSLSFSPWTLNLSAKNMDNESVEDKLDINFDGESIKIAFNINYLLDVLGILESENINISLQDSQSSCLIYDSSKENARYIIMPMNI